MTIKKMTQKETAEVYQAVERYTRAVDPENNIIEYIGEWSDAKIAEQCGVSVSSVTYVRQNNFGKLQNRPAPVVNTGAALSAASVGEQLATISREIAAMRADIRALRADLNASRGASGPLFEKLETQQ